MAKIESVWLVKWKPDPKLGYFDNNGVYHNRRIGTDIFGVEYTIMDVGMQTKRGFIKMFPGDKLRISLA